MTGDLHLEVLLAAGYSLFLTVVAAGLEWFGRHSHRRSGQFRTAGFRYHQQLDVWECPCGHRLHRYRDEPARRLVRYRAPAHTCNACAKKPDCTDSHRGREIAHSSIPWLASEAGRFHRGMSLILLALATFILAVEMVRHQTSTELLVLGSILASVAAAKLRLIRSVLAGSNRGGPAVPGIRTDTLVREASNKERPIRPL